MPEAFDSITDELGREDDRSLEDLLEDASNLQLKEALTYAYFKLPKISQEQVRIYLTS